MKPASFVYEKPSTLRDALDILAAHDDARVLAGGQTLVPMMAFRIVRPAVVVDINRLAELDFCNAEGEALRIGALTRHARFHQPVTNGPIGHLLATVVKYIAHGPIRTRGTFCGSLAYADPSSEWCLVAAALDGTVVVEGAGSRREIPAAHFFLGFMATAMEHGEMIVETRLPLLPSDTRFGFCEFSRRAGDFSLAMALVVVGLSDGRINDARIALGGVEGHPRRMHEAEQTLLGQFPSDRLVREAVETAVKHVDPLEDAQADAAMRLDLGRAMVDRALKRALSC